MKSYKLRKPLRPLRPDPGIAAQSATKPEVSAALVDEFLRLIKSQFYFEKPDSYFFQHRPMLIRAITFPANWLAARGMTREISADRYRQLIADVIQEVKRFGQMSSAHSPAHYFFRVVQTHMDHHGEGYYDECRSVRNAVAQVTSSLAAKPEGDSTLGDLAHLHRIVASPGGRRRVTQASPQPQLDLFQ